MDANGLHQRACVADAHADSLMWNRDLTQQLSRGHVDFVRLKAAGVKLQCFTIVTRGFPMLGAFRVFMSYRRWPKQARRSEWVRAIWQIDQLMDFCERSRGQVRVAKRRKDLEDNLREGRISAVLGVEGAHAVEGRIERVGELFAKGVRFMSLTHLSNNELGGSSFPLMPPKRLTTLGRAILDEMTRLRMAVDVAHASRRTLKDILSHPTARLFCSHTGVSGVAPMWRNLSDDALRRIAERGGVVGIIFGTVYLGGRKIDDLVRHIEHAANVAGEDAVAFGSDFDGMVPLPRGMNDVRDLHLLTQALLQRHPERWVEKIIGGNLTRFLADILGEESLPAPA